MGWSATQYDCWTTDGIKPVHGFSNGVFGIDERPNLRWPARKKAWAVIHIGTGYAAAFVEGGRQVAQRFADEMTDAADWELSGPEDAKSRSSAVRPVFAANDSILLSSSDVGALKPAFRYPEETAIADQSPKGRDAQRLDAKHASGGAKQSPDPSLPSPPNPTSKRTA